jgi:hypothetical protein
MGCAVFAFASLVGSLTPGGAAERPVLDIPRVALPPVLDDYDSPTPGPVGSTQLQHVTGFIQNAPVDGDPASQRTAVYLGYDDSNFYAVFVAHDAQPNLIRANLSRREQTGSDDIVEVMLDTYSDQRRAYAFVVNPLGIQWDAIWTEGEGFDSSWDTLWHSQGRRTDYGYVVMMTIPFRSLRFAPLDHQEWGMLLVRDVKRNNETSFWPHVSTRIEGRLNQAATIRGLSGISPGRNVELIPYVTSRSFRLLDPDATPEPGFVEDAFDADAGMDAKFVVLDNVAIDATVNPDFSQVESDNPQVTVNQRFEVFFPEKRPFFLENAGFFQTTTNLLFTRRIRDPQFGVRTTGKLGRFAFGGLLIDDEAPGKSVPDDDRLRGNRAYVGALRVNRDIYSQSTLGFLLTDRELESSYNRVAAVDTRIRLTDTWDARAEIARSWARELNGTTFTDPLYNVQFNRNGRHSGTHLHYFDVGADFNAYLGFVPRADIRDLHQQLSYTFRPEGDVLISWGPSFFWQTIWDHQGTRLDWQLQPEIDWELTRQTDLELQYRVRGERLRPEDFSALTENVDFTPWEVQFEIDSKFSNVLGAQLELRTGRAVNFVPPEGELPDLEELREVEFDFVWRPTTAFNISNDYTYAQLVERQSSDIIFENQILRSRWSWQLDRRLSIRAIFQFEKLDANSTLSRLEKERLFNTDVLLTYQVNAWTALYAGYNTNFLNVDLLDTPDGPQVGVTEDLNNDSRQFFVKFSYLLRI